MRHILITISMLVALLCGTVFVGCGGSGNITSTNTSPAPTITGFTPTNGPIGTVITIIGTNLTGTTAVKFNGTTATSVTIVSATLLTATVSTGAATGKISVATPSGTATSATDFTVSSGGTTDGAVLVWVPGGSFTMGTPQNAWGGNQPYTQQVTLSGYWIDKYEVTVAQYRTFCAATGYALPTWPGNQYSWEGKSGWNDAALQQHPIVNVSWYDAKAYADWAGMALPTEAQWEYAARGQQGNNYPWGGTVTAFDGGCNGWDQTKCANYGNSYGQNISTWPVGSFSAGASWCGAHDMAGNVWEWCADWYGPYSTTSVTNPPGPTTGTDRVIRGGSWYWSGDGECRGATRGLEPPPCEWYGIGFRCVSSSPGP